MGKYVLICDIGGIQRYIFDISKNKSATKRLKWRSFFVELLLRKIVCDLKKDIWFQEFTTSGGKAILICDNFDKEKFEKYKFDLEQKVYIQFYAQLKIFFWIASYDENNFKTSLQNAFDDLEINKKSSFISQLQTKEKTRNESAFVFEWDRWEQTVCPFTRWDIVCKSLNDDIHIKNILEEEDVDWISLNAYNDIVISNFLAGDWKNKEITLFDGLKDTIKIEEKDKKYIPKNEKNQIKSFEEIAWEKWFNKLVCLKWDIDNLGKIFTLYLKEENYEENYKILSQKLDEFWNKKLYELIYKKDIYVVYAGGDDFLIVGRWNEIIKFYEELKKYFQKEISNNTEIQNLFTTEQKIHFSWAINLFGPHDTFFTVVKQTEELLKEAKEFDDKKNKINIFGQVIANDEFDKIIAEVEKFREKYLSKDKDWKSDVSIWTLRFLLWIAKKIIAEANWENENMLDYAMRRAELFYHLSRNYKSKKWNEKKDEFRKDIDSMLLHNEVKEIHDLFGIKKDYHSNNLETWKKLLVMITYLLYLQRDNI